ncbi:MAG: ABC transporter substrate-binding protein, partial [Actinomycetes bacterium]
MSHLTIGGVRHSGRLLLTLLLVAAAALAPAAVALAASSPSPDARTSLHIGWVQDVDNLNPFIGLQGTDYMLWHLNYDFLVGFDARTLEPRPELATAWEVSADGKEWTFTIRSDSTFQDGVPVTAGDVAFTFNYIHDNELLNLATYTNGIVKAEAIDDTTVKIYTDAPKANMLRMVVPILPEHIWSKVSGKAATSTYQNTPPIVGNGPFQIVEWQKGKFVRLEANPDYWGGAPKVDEVIFQLYTNADTMVQDLKLGTIDGALDVPPAQFKPLSSEPGLEANNATSWRFIEIGMNCYDNPSSLGNPVLLDPELRRAVNWAVDRQKVTDIAYQGYATVGSTIIVPYSKYHWEPPADSLFTYDPAKANELLDAAGYKDVNGDG